jgi:hypothetical protein
MKDAKGHGSDAHQTGVEEATRPPSPHEGVSGTFTHIAGGDLAKQGFTPAKRASGTDVTGALRVGWTHAINTNAPATVTHTGRGGLTILRTGDKIPYGQSHMVVHPNGKVYRYNRAETYDGL